MSSKYEMLLAQQQLDGTNKLSKTHASVEKYRSVYNINEKEWHNKVYMYILDISNNAIIRIFWSSPCDLELSRFYCI